MHKNLSYANIATPVPHEKWQKMSASERLAVIKHALESDSLPENNILTATDAKQDGQIIVNFVEPIGASRRGSILLDAEELLKGTIDPALTVWLEPLGDRNSLRNLRGIEVKS